MSKNNNGKQPTAAWPHKIRPVKVSEMRVPPVGVSQRRYSESQAAAIAENFDLNKFGIIAVNWRDEIYWILDGQHRIEALKRWFAPSDPGQIDCNVYTGLSDAEMAELFIGLNTRRAVNSFDLFLTSCTAERTRESAIRRVVESNGCVITQDKTRENGIGAVAALCEVYDRADDVVLGQVVRTLSKSFHGDPLSFDARLLRGVGAVFNRFNGKTSEATMVAALGAQKNVMSVIRKAEAMHEATGNQKSQCVAATVVELYNRSLGRGSKHRLPLWWQSADPEPKA